MQELINKIQRDFIKAEEEIINKVLKQLLERDPNIEDYKKCAIIRKIGDFLDYELSYDGIKIMEIKYHLPDFNNKDYKSGVEFISFYPNK